MMRRRCASRPTNTVPPASNETIDGTSPSPDASRITTGVPSFTYATRLLVVPRSMPTTLPMGRCLAVDRPDQVRDVVALEHALPQGLENAAAFLRGSVCAQRIPPLAQLADALLVLDAASLDRRL